MNKEVFKQYEELKRNRDIINTIEPEFFFEIVDYLLKENEEWDRKFYNLQNLYFKLQDESESKRKEYQETYKDVREELKELKENKTGLEEEIQEQAKNLIQNEEYITEECILKEKVKDKIEKEIKYHEKNILDIENVTMLKSKTAKEEAEIEFNKYAIIVLKKILQELIEERSDTHENM